MSCCCGTSAIYTAKVHPAIDYTSIISPSKLFVRIPEVTPPQQDGKDCPQHSNKRKKKTELSGVFYKESHSVHLRSLKQHFMRTVGLVLRPFYAKLALCSFTDNNHKCVHLPLCNMVPCNILIIIFYLCTEYCQCYGFKCLH